MKRLGIVEFIMSAGGVERVLRGLAAAFLEIPEAREWDITFLLSRYNSARQRCKWPAELSAPNLRVEWLGEQRAVSRFLDRVAAADGMWRVPVLRTIGPLAALTVREMMPARWRAPVGGRAALIEEASERFDLLYFTYPVWMKAPRGLRTPVAATLQDFNYRHFHAEGTPIRRQHEAAAVSWMERADRLLFSSDAVYDELREFYPQYTRKAEVVPLGVAVGERQPSTEEVESVRRAHALPGEFVLVPGWVAPHKNQLALVEAMRLLRERGALLPVVFVGPHTAGLAGEARAENPYAEQVRVALRSAGFTAPRDFLALGYVDDLGIRCLYRMATVCVIPSMYEGFGLPALEAKLAGCPSLLAAIPPFHEQNRRLGDTGGTFDPRDPKALADGIAWVSQNRDTARAMARLSSERVSRFYDWKNTARAYLAAFAAVIDQNERAGQSRG